jgi:hypothetical protein
VIIQLREMSFHNTFRMCVTTRLLLGRSDRDERLSGRTLFVVGSLKSLCDILHSLELTRE